MKLSTILLIFFLNISSFGQKFESIRHFNKINETSPNIIYNVEEDKNNFFWLATDDGIIKYNGTTFKKFTTKNGLPSNDIFKIKIDSKNRIWLTGYYEGLYYIYNDKVYKVKASDKYNTLEYIYEKSDTVFFKNQYYNYTTFVKKNNVLEKLHFNHKTVRLKSFYKGKMEVFYDFNSKEHFVLENNKKTKIPKDYYFYPNLSTSKPFFVKDHDYVKYHPSNRLIKNDIIYFEDNKLHEFIDILPKNEKIRILNRDFESNYTIFESKNKVYFFNNNKLDSQASHFFTNLPVDKSKIYFTFLDNSKNVWIITNDNQLVFVPKNYFIISSVANNQIFNSENTTIKYGVYTGNNHLILSNNNVFYTYVPKENKLIKIDEYKNEIPYKIIIHNKKIIVCSNKFLHYYDMSFKLIERKYIISSKNSKIIDDKLNYARGSSMWDANNELFKIKNTIRFKDFEKLNGKYICSNENSIISKSLIQGKYLIRNLKYINVIQKFQNNLIVGTNSNGIYYLDDSLKTISKVDFDENVCDIKIDGKLIYVLSTKSLHIFEIINNKFLLKNVKTNKEGLINPKLSNIDFDNDNIYVYGQNGISIVKKDELYNVPKAEIDIECSEFSVYNKNSIELERNNNNLNFTYNINTFENPSSFKKFIKIEREGENKNWEILKSNNIIFKDLKQGNYKISFKLTSENPSFNTKTKEIKFTILPYFWETKLFVAILLGLTFISIYFVFVLYQNREKRKAQIIQKMNDLELKALKSQMNPHFIFNTLNSLQSVVFTKDEKHVNNYFIKFSKLLRSTLDILNSDKVTLMEEINYIKSYIELEQIRNHNSFIYELDCDEEINLKKIEIPVMILQPLIENAIEHGINKIKERGVLKIKIKKTPNDVIISIIDNGKGINFTKINFKDSNKDKSYAMKIIKDRIKILNIIHSNKYKIEWIDLVSIKEQGTQVDFYIKQNFK